MITLASLDPDFRRDPKTGYYCVVCQRDLKAGSGEAISLLGDDDQVIVGVIGPECKKKISQKKETAK